MTSGDPSHGFGGPNPIGGGHGPGDAAQWGSAPPPAPAGPPPQWPHPPQQSAPPWPNPTAPPSQQWGSPAPPHQQPPHGGFGGPPYPGQQPYGQQPFGPGQMFAPAPKNRTRLWLAIGAAVVVVIVVIAGVAVFSGSSSTGAKTAGEAVQGYLEALARGDADAALSFADAPADKAFLTDEILKKQIEKYPITDIKVLSDVPGNAGGAEVHVVASFGGTKSDESITLSKPAAGQGWKLEHGAVEVNLGRDSPNLTMKPELADLVTIFGKQAPKSGKAYLFPGWVDFGSSNPNIDIHAYKEEPPSLQEIWLGLSHQRPEFGVSDSGTKAILDQVKAIIDKCVKSNQLSPPDCPNGTPSDGLLIEGTAQWTAPASLDDIKPSYLKQDTATVEFYGSAEFGLKVQTTSRNLPVYQTTQTESIDGVADMLQNPPKVTLKKFG